ncbi:PAS domain-containing sensor histidine kinase [Pelosinus baikalensis]|uniref:histidine kinase n=1 Tax=Pelosinus baikalensis TaxID=2892015 RepID=A0ABS8HZG9_9FIRM|nr:PAS domain-containing sensor histidine kinase [Pelosinus baikalensis]MCC5468011.1 PAS domain-containing protein [Pelosinus baikalensis]
MDYIFLSTLCAITGTILMMVIYTYLYSVYREKYMGAWIIGWFIHFTRIALFESGVIAWKQSLLSCIVYQMLYISCATMLLYSAHLVIKKPLNKYWLYGATIASILNVVFDIMQLSVFWKLTPPAWFAGTVLICIGRFFIYQLQIKKGTGNYITGYAFILWGIVTAAVPFFSNDTIFFQWITLIAGVLRLVIASGILLVYFEKTRLDLANKEAQYRLLADNAVDVIYRYRILPDTKFEYVSPSVFAVTGYTAEEFYADSKLFENLIHPDDLLLFKQSTNNPPSNELPLKYCLIRKDKNTVHVEQKYHPTYDKAGNLAVREGILRDVTARENLEQIAARADRMNMLGEMAANVAHEIRNPLTTVRGYLQMMLGKDELSNYKSRLSTMMEEIDRTDCIIREYLLLAKDKRVEMKNCSLNSIVDKLFPLIQADAAASNVLVNLELKEISPLYLDENEIRQLLLNLVRNGVESMPTGGELTICTGLEQDKIVLSIKDQGTGLPANILEKLGTPFLTTKDTGTGLGIPICYRIANRHNAAIDVKTGDQGTTFCVSFNLARLAS